MEKNTELPKRKALRLTKYNYSSSGTYFITICVKDKSRILSDIIKPAQGGGVQIILTKIGKTVEKYLLSSGKIPGVFVDRYVIMPDHIHAIIIVHSGNESDICNGRSKARTNTNEKLPHIVSTFKRLCTKEIGYSIFQRGYYEHIVRGKEDYETISEYIRDNPKRWYHKESSNENKTNR